MKSKFYTHTGIGNRRISITKPDRGFTLIEIMVGVAIAFLVMAAIFEITSAINKTYTTHDKRTELQQSARAALDYMAYFIRAAGLNPKGIGSNAVTENAPGIVNYSATSIEFTADWQSDGDIKDDLDDHILFNYNAANNTIERSDLYGENPAAAVDPPYTIIGNIAPLVPGDPSIFRYWSGQDPPVEIIQGDPNFIAEDIRIVEINLKIRESTGTKANLEKSLMLRIRPRNLGNF